MIYARLPYEYKATNFRLSLRLTDPLGNSYSDELTLPVAPFGIEVKSYDSGLWRDYSWNYRKEVLFTHTGEWIFEIKMIYPTKLPDQAVGVLINRSQENGKK